MQSCGSLSRFNGVTGSISGSGFAQNRKKLIKKYSKKFQLRFISFLQFLVIKTLDPNWIRIPIHLTCWIWIRIQWIRVHNSGWIYDAGCYGLISLLSNVRLCFFASRSLPEHGGNDAPAQQRHSHGSQVSQVRTVKPGQLNSHPPSVFVWIRIRSDPERSGLVGSLIRSNLSGNGCAVCTLGWNRPMN